jgi:hypothetical protein
VTEQSGGNTLIYFCLKREYLSGGPMAELEALGLIRRTHTSVALRFKEDNTTYNTAFLQLLTGDTTDGF